MSHAFHLHSMKHGYHCFEEWSKTIVHVDSIWQDINPEHFKQHCKLTLDLNM